MKEAILEPLLRKMRLSRVLPYVRKFENPSVLDVGCGWEARLLREIEPFIAKGIGIDFKAPDIKTQKLQTFSYFFENKGSDFMHSTKSSVLDSRFNGAPRERERERETRRPVIWG